MNKPTWIFRETSVPAIVARLRREWPGRRRPLTLQSLAQLLGYRSPRLIAMIEKGQRAPSDEFLTRLATKAALTTKQREYLELLARKKDPALPEKLETLRKESREPRVFPEETFRFMSDWRNMVLLQLFLTSKGENLKPERLKKRLKADLSVGDIEKSLELLLRLGVIAPQDDGYVFVPAELQATQDNIPSKARQDHHLAMMEQAKEALHRDLFDQRDMNSYTFRAPADRLQEMKSDVLEFLIKMNSKYHTKDARDVFQLNIQLFSHTRPEIPPGGTR